MSLELFNKCEAFNQMQWMSHGTDCQRCQYQYKDTVITEDVRFYFNVFKKSKVWYTVDLILPADSKTLIEKSGGTAIDSDTYYAPEGYWFAQFEDSQKLVNFIDNVLPTLNLPNLEVLT